MRAICKLYEASGQLAQRLILFEIGNRLELLIYGTPVPIRSHLRMSAA